MQQSPDSFEEPTHYVMEPSQNRARPIDTGENYDLVVVGGGISGLAAAYFACSDGS
jgi:ribulose 1,5-bisphosphate synthetase/thiazole synthase